MMRSLPIVAALAGLLPAVSVAADKADEAARAAILKLVPQATIDAVEPAPMAGFRQVLLGGRATFAATFGGSLAARWPPREPPCGRRATSVPPASARPCGGRRNTAARTAVVERLRG